MNLHLLVSAGVTCEVSQSRVILLTTTTQSHLTLFPECAVLNQMLMIYFHIK